MSTHQMGQEAQAAGPGILRTAFCGRRGRIVWVGAALLGLLAAGWILAARMNHPVTPASRVALLRASAPPGMIFVPAGPFWMGSDSPDADVSTPGKHRAWTPAFYLDRYPVTNAEFAAFDRRHHFKAGQENFPVTNVTWSQATAYLKAQGKTLPTEAEWEKAARGTDGRVFPWGNKPENYLHPTLGRRSIRAVTGYKQPASPYGARAMCGAVWQWVRDNQDGNPHQQIIRGGASGYTLHSDTTYARGVEGAGVT